MFEAGDHWDPQERTMLTTTRCEGRPLRKGLKPSAVDFTTSTVLRLAVLDLRKRVWRPNAIHDSASMCVGKATLRGSTRLVGAWD